MHDPLHVYSSYTTLLATYSNYHIKPIYNIIPRPYHTPTVTLSFWNDKSGGFPLPVSYSCSSFVPWRTLPSCTHGTWPGSPRLLALPKVLRWCSVQGWRKTEWKTSPCSSSLTLCALRSHTCHCSKPTMVQLFRDTKHFEKIFFFFLWLYIEAYIPEWYHQH